MYIKGGGGNSHVRLSRVGHKKLCLSFLNVFFDGLRFVAAIPGPSTKVGRGPGAGAAGAGGRGLGPRGPGAGGSQVGEVTASAHFTTRTIIQLFISTPGLYELRRVE